MSINQQTSTQTGAKQREFEKIAEICIAKGAGAGLDNKTEVLFFKDYDQILKTPEARRAVAVVIENKGTKEVVTYEDYIKKEPSIAKDVIGNMGLAGRRGVPTPTSPTSPTKKSYLSYIPYLRERKADAEAKEAKAASDTYLAEYSNYRYGQSRYGDNKTWTIQANATGVQQWKYAPATKLYTESDLLRWKDDDMGTMKKWREEVAAKLTTNGRTYYSTTKPRWLEIDQIGMMGTQVCVTCMVDSPDSEEGSIQPSKPFLYPSQRTIQAFKLAGDRFVPGDPQAICRLRDRVVQKQRGGAHPRTVVSKAMSRRAVQQQQQQRGGAPNDTEARKYLWDCARGENNQLVPYVRKANKDIHTSEETVSFLFEGTMNKFVHKVKEDEMMKAIYEEGSGEKYKEILACRVFMSQVIRENMIRYFTYNLRIRGWTPETSDAAIQQRKNMTEFEIHRDIRRRNNDAIASMTDEDLLWAYENIVNQHITDKVHVKPRTERPRDHGDYVTYDEAIDDTSY